MVTRESLLEFLDAHRIDYREAGHEAVCTMADSAKLNLALPGCRCKNLFVQGRKEDGRFLVVAPPDAAVDLAALGRATGVGRLSLCQPSEMVSRFGVELGALSPFALLGDWGDPKVRVLFDSSLESVPCFLFHPLVNTATVSITREDLFRFLRAIDHPPEFVDLPRRTGIAMQR
ncbi:MAG TPA: prolyl-tRNA synthetase associated domain-containing protein [Burkholderiaceae bacterium]|nr:prolyl-tRNA synthetase associated domain-containing protein [Burkholderiaceae bacterium]